jgi:hypothetical protein
LDDRLRRRSALIERPDDRLDVGALPGDPQSDIEHADHNRVERADDDVIGERDEQGGQGAERQPPSVEHLGDMLDVDALAGDAQLVIEDADHDCAEGGDGDVDRE